MLKSSKFDTGVRWTQKLSRKFRELRDECNSLLGGDYLAQAVLGHEGGCVVQRCLGNPRTCRICRPVRRDQYNELEEEDYRPVDLGANALEDYREIILMRFYLGSPQVKTFHPLLVSRNMTAHDVVKGIAVIGNTSDHYRYGIAEFWREYEAERIIDDHEKLLDLRSEHLSAQQHFLFVYVRTLDKYHFAQKKSKYFINPTIAREKNRRKKQTDDPALIQVLDPYFASANDVLDAPPSRLRVLLDSTPAEQKKAAEAAREESTPKELPLERTDSVEIEIEPMSADASVTEADDSILSVDSAMPLLSSLLKKPASAFAPVIPENERVNPIYCGTIYAKTGNRDLTVDEAKALPKQKEKVKWAKKYLLLRNRILYFVKDHETMLKYYFMEDSAFSRVVDKNYKAPKSSRTLTLIAPVSDFEVYIGVKARRHHNAPYGGSVYLREHVGNLRKPTKLMFCPKPLPNVTSTPDDVDLSSHGRTLWMTALRLAKHGVKLIEGHETFMRERMEYSLREQMNPDPRVAMDFTEGTGRIIHDEAEIEQIRREPKQAYRFERFENFPPGALQHGPHLTQKYYHGNLNRAEAEAKLFAAQENGSWLLRTSHARANCLTISLLHNGRIYHKYIAAAPLHDPSCKVLLYVATLDHKLAFYDVHSLTKFYRLNKSESMVCMLGPSVKNDKQPDSSPTRAVVHERPRSSTRPISLVPGTSKDSSAQSPRSLKTFFSKSTDKSKPAAKSKKSTIGAGAPLPMPSGEDLHADYMTAKDVTRAVSAHIRSSAGTSAKPSTSGAASDPSPQV